MQTYLFNYRPPVKPRPNPHGVFSDVVKFKLPQPIEPAYVTDNASLVPFSGNASDSSIVSDVLSLSLSAVEFITGYDNEGLQASNIIEPSIISDSIYFTAFNILESVSPTDNSQLIYSTIDSVVSDSFALSTMKVTDNTLSDSVTFIPPQKAALEVLYVSDSTTGFILSYTDTITESEVFNIAGKNIEGLYLTDNGNLVGVR